MCVSVFHDLTDLNELAKNIDDVACIDDFLVAYYDKADVR